MYPDIDNIVEFGHLCHYRHSYNRIHRSDATLLQENEKNEGESSCQIYSKLKSQHRC